MIEKSHEVLCRYLSSHTPLAPAIIHRIANQFKFKHFNKGDILMEQGQTNCRLFFIVSGIVYAGTPRIDGVFRVDYFPSEGEFFSDIDMWYNHKPARYTFVAATKCRVLCIGQEAIEQLITQYPEIILYVKEFGELAMKEITNQQLLLRIVNKQERYQEFENRFPKLANSADGIFLAPFLQISYSYFCHLRRKRA